MHYLSPRRSVLVQLGRAGLSVLLMLTLLSIATPGIARASSGYGGCRLTHRVSAGETLTQIAARYGLSVDELARMNKLDDVDYIYEHQQLCIPDNGGRGFEENGFDNGGFDNGFGYRGFEENGFDNGEWGRDPRIYGSVEWSYGDENGKNGFDNGYRGYGDNGYGRGGYDKPYGGPGYGGE